jgi:hypothetical protein
MTGPMGVQGNAPSARLLSFDVGIGTHPGGPISAQLSGRQPIRPGSRDTRLCHCPCRVCKLVAALSVAKRFLARRFRLCRRRYNSRDESGGMKASVRRLPPRSSPARPAYRPGLQVSSMARGIPARSARIAVMNPTSRAKPATASAWFWPNSRTAIPPVVRLPGRTGRIRR